MTPAILAYLNAARAAHYTLAQVVRDLRLFGLDREQIANVIREHNS